MIFILAEIPFGLERLVRIAPRAFCFPVCLHGCLMSANGYIYAPPRIVPFICICYGVDRGDYGFIDFLAFFLSRNYGPILPVDSELSRFGDFVISN